MLNIDLILLSFWSFTILPISLGVIVIFDGTLGIPLNPKIIRNIIRVLKFAFSKKSKATKKILRFSVISAYITSRLIRFIGTTKLKKSLGSTFNSENHF